MAEHMLGYMQDLQRIYETAPRPYPGRSMYHYPGFYRCARLVEALSEKNEAMKASGAHAIKAMSSPPAPQRPRPIPAVRSI
ncbi:hypothetical protein SAMN04488498_15113 [Mesorhizobium albiziae]|uniref:Uncharacterized protein n=1 Tax=Neomesorhizobium albiziae TaxID=335020 RepID=A0A1I4FNM4_9HYPH|nr:hypothetical protein GCM10007937_26010 [Mesorhizobium albiziae]SFL18900.1 hypothetical protein SAMN04488498_15113 [Mesorhizobium albiziae]